MEERKKIEDGNEVILGKDYSNAKRMLAFLSIVVIYFFYCYNFMVGTFVKPIMVESAANGGFGFTIKQTSKIFAVMSFGTIPGTIIFGVLSSKIGKKYTLMIVATLISLSTFIPMLDYNNYGLWMAARFVTGFTLGGVFGTAMPLTAEIFPKKYRGKMSAILTSLFSLAMIFGGAVYGALGDANWKLLMYTAIIPPVIGTVMVFFFVPNDYEHMKALNKKAAEEKEKISYLNMYKGKYALIGLGVILLSGANFTAYSAFSNNATMYLRESVGYSAAVAGSIYSIQGMGQLIGYNFWGIISDKFGRKKPLAGMALSALVMFLYLKIGADGKTMYMIASLVLGICFGYSGAWGAYYTELFPEKFSSMSAGISFNGGRIISSLVLPVIVGFADTTVNGVRNFQATFYASMIILVIGAVIWLLLPETFIKKSEKK